MEEKNNCCGGCKNGKPGQNSACKAKIMIKAIAEKQRILKRRVLTL